MNAPSNQHLFEANGCLKMAEGQLAGARSQLHGTDTGTYRRSCFASHQTIEMSLKGLTWFHTKSAPKQTHSFRKLLSNLEDFPQFQHLQEQIVALEALYIGSRYVYEDQDGNLVEDYSRSEAERAYLVAKDVYETIRGIVTENFQ